MLVADWKDGESMIMKVKEEDGSCTGRPTGRKLYF